MLGGLVEMYDDSDYIVMRNSLIAGSFTSNDVRLLMDHQCVDRQKEDGRKGSVIGRLSRKREFDQLQWLAEVREYDVLTFRTTFRVSRDIFRRVLDDIGPLIDRQGNNKLGTCYNYCSV